MELALSNSGCPRMCSGKPYLSGELRSKKYYKYGLLEGRIKAAKGSGIVTSLFFYTGTSGKSDHHEIDLEFLGRDTRKMQATYFVKGKMAHKKLIDLKFDASQDFHTYGIRWGKTSIQWLVDGKTVHSVVGSPASLPHRPARIIMNLWPGIDRPDIRDWLGRFSYNGPISAYYDWVRFTPQ